MFIFSDIFFSYVKKFSTEYIGSLNNDKTMDEQIEKWMEELEKVNKRAAAKIKKQRANDIMKIQKEVSKENNEKMIGKVLNCLIENITEDGKYYLGRSYREVPEDTDGTIYVENTKDIIIGDFVDIEIIDALEYDLIGRVV